MRIMRNLSWALLAIGTCAAILIFNSCSEYELYAPDGPIQKRVHDVSVMCVSYLFESGGSTLSDDYAKYAPDIIRILDSEAGKLEAICKSPGDKYSKGDVDVMAEAAKAMRDMSMATKTTLDALTYGRPKNEAGSPWYEWTQLDRVSKYIDDPHRHMGSTALYE